jgi:hypothetical protein
MKLLENNMNMLDQTAIELSRKKIGQLFIAACVFVAIGILMLLQDDASIRSVFHRGQNLTYVHGVGIFSILFFGLCAIYSFIKLLDKKAGLIFSVAGIIDNASGVSAGLIPWTEIMGAKTSAVNKQEFLIIEVKDPQKYLTRGNWLKRAATSASYKMCGSPITIPTVTLKISFPELLSIFNQYQQKYGNPKPGD